MGFIARTIFWLGLVYSAMPLDFGSLFADRAPAWRTPTPLAACAAGVDGGLPPARRRAAQGARRGGGARNCRSRRGRDGNSRRRHTDAAAQTSRDPSWIDEAGGPRSGRYKGGHSFGGCASRAPGRRDAAPPCFGEAPVTQFDTIQEDFAFLDDWEDRYRYVIELGRALEPLTEDAHNDANKVRGCVSQVWIEREPRANPDGRTILHFRGDSDSHLVRGLVAIAFALYSDRTPQAKFSRRTRMSTFRELGLEQHLTPQRSNGVRSMIERIRSDARRV